MKTPRKITRDLLIILAPDKGLCGALIANIIKQTYEYNKENQNTIYLTMGKKIEKYTSLLDKEIVGSFKFGATLPNYDIVFPLIDIINEYFLTQKVKSVKILYSKFINVFSQKQEIIDILPIKLAPIEKSEQTRPITLFEPSVQTLLPPLLKHYIETTIFQSILEAYASEQGARMISMQNATNNAIDITKELKLEYNKARQEKITNEILDIGSASFS